MKKSIWLVPLLFGLNMVFIFIGCDEPNRQSTSPTTSSASKMSDSDLEQAIRSKFESDAQLKDAKLNVDADVDQNEVTISGTVRSQEIRNKAVELTKGVQSGLTINDKIDVKPAA